MQFIKARTYYEDLYDLFTVKECLDWYWKLHDGMEVYRKELQDKEPKIDFDHEVLKCCSYTVNAIKGERYRHRAERIKEWMDRDEHTQKKFNEAMPPIGIVCKDCNGPTRLIMKDFDYRDGQESRVWFMFECLKCKRRACNFEDGAQWELEKEKCSKCGLELSIHSRRVKEKIIDEVKCLNCMTSEKIVHDFGKSHREFEDKQEKDRILLEKYRSEFCLTDENGPGYIQQMDDLKRFVDEAKERERKEDTPEYKKTKQLQKLRVHELLRLLIPLLEKEGYVNLSLGKPEMGRFVVVDFTATDNKDERDEYHSRNELKKVITDALEATNWQLMSEGIAYRLGINSGRLRAYEHEDDLINLFLKKH